MTENLSAHVYACINLRIPETGDKDIDAFIRKANLRDASVAAMQGLLASGEDGMIEGVNYLAKWACDQASALIAEMERRENEK